MPRAIDHTIRDALWQAHQHENLDSRTLAQRFDLCHRTVQNLLRQAHLNNDIMPAAAYHSPIPASKRHATEDSMAKDKSHSAKSKGTLA